MRCVLCWNKCVGSIQHMLCVNVRVNTEYSQTYSTPQRIAVFFYALTRYLTFSCEYQNIWDMGCVCFIALCVVSILYSSHTIYIQRIQKQLAYRAYMYKNVQYIRIRIFII